MIIGMILGLIFGLILNFYVNDYFIKNIIFVDNIFYLGGTLFLNHPALRGQGFLNFFHLID